MDTTISQAANRPGSKPGGTMNAVVLCGRLRHPPETRQLASGAVLVTIRLVMPRPDPAPGARRTSDWVDCAIWQPSLRRRVAGWREGDQVEIRGALRRRFFRSGGGETGTRLEVEVSGGKVLRRARGDARQS